MFSIEVMDKNLRILKKSIPNPVAYCHKKMPNLNRLSMLVIFLKYLTLFNFHLNTKFVKNRQKYGNKR